jgi:hypothetical protein
MSFEQVDKMPVIPEYEEDEYDDDYESEEDEETGCPHCKYSSDISEQCYPYCVFEEEDD